jgi:predicted PurR-regulated permease PerM
MEITEKDIKRFLALLLVAVLTVLTFLVIKPVLVSIIGGLILAFVFFPIYKKIAKYVKYESLAAALVSIIVLIIILLPIWFLTPILMQQIFDIFKYSQELDIAGILSSILPATPSEVISQLEIPINNALGKVTSAILNSLVDFILNFAVITLHLILVAFVFFFALKDESKLRSFVSDLSPLNKNQEKAMIKQFKDITSSVINGQIIAGLVQGILAGIAFILFGVPNALILTILSVIVGIIPILGLSIVYIPVTIFLFLTGNPFIALLYLTYNVLIVSTVDNLLRAHLVSRKTQLSQVVVLIGMIGGLFLFGVLGLILGPLILAYFITFLRAYKDKTLSSLFSAS